jgi:dual-specificity kinase
MLPTYPHQPLNHNPINGAATTPPPPFRKRKRAQQILVKYNEVQELDDEGNVREVIVIDDSPPPPLTISPATTARTNECSASYQPPHLAAPIRTRARAAAEAQWNLGANGAAAPPNKKRKKEFEDYRPAAKRVLAGAHPTPANRQLPNGAPTSADVCIVIASLLITDH